LYNISDKHEVHFTALKKKAVQKPSLEPKLAKLILWYFGCATFWLVVGTGIGEYLGIKFIAPDIDHSSWLSFGRLRPVHTNIVFWGWASLAMIGLGYYVVPIVSNTKIYSVKWGWIALGLTNLMVVLGSLCLMAGINNGGGEFREYIWPVMALFAVALILTLANFLMTVAKRTTKEIYISNWYIVSAIIFTIIVALTAYLPFWQDGVSETIVQGYFMHSGVGMWFTLYTLGLLYYFIPQQINKPIYAYSLGILAFWTQIIFYTIIGTHHFVFAPLPWWLQTVAIVGSAGMIIPVIAATINYTMTFKGQWHKVTTSYTLPFFLVAVVYYFIVSMQGTAEAFKFTNLIWHFTDFTVAHAHLGFYGIITFALWGGFYVVIPRLTGKEPPQHLVGAHFWLAFIGLLFYAIPLSVGATLRGLMWMDGKPFIDSVVLMFDYWLWRAIGGSLMFISHLVFAFNFYKMTIKEVAEIDVKEEAFKIIASQTK
jgi:cytochrome c oxidase cbb3-type subunit 1